MHKNKIKIFFICPYPIAHAASQRFRFEQYLTCLRENGFEVEFYSFWDQPTWLILYKRGYFFHKAFGLLKSFLRRIMLITTMSEALYVFIHREATPIGPPWFEWITAKVLKKQVIYDFDDAIWLPNTSAENKWVTYLKWHSKVENICRWSYKVSCGNNYLVDFAKRWNKNVILNPTTIDTLHLHNPQLYRSQKHSDKVTIGWTGTHSTLPYLELLHPVFQALENKFYNKIELIVIADKKPHLPISHFRFIKWRKETEIEDLLLFDIGIMPLVDDIWAKGKCGFKALQYMALAIPTVASPIGVNEVIVQNEVNGFLCTTHEEWVARLSILITDQPLRVHFGARGRETVQKGYSVFSNTSNFLDLFS